MKNPLGTVRKYPTERQLWQRIKPKFEQGGSRAYRIEAVATPGFPDVVWCPYMRPPHFIELKAGPLIIRTAQKKFIKDLNALGFSVWVVWQKERRGQVLVLHGMTTLDWGGSFHGTDLDEWIAWILEQGVNEQKQRQGP